MAYIQNRMLHYFEDTYYAVNHQCTNMSCSALRFIHLTAVWACNYAHADLHSHHAVVQNRPNQSQLHCEHNISLFTSCRFLENRSPLLVLWSTVLVNNKKKIGHVSKEAQISGCFPTVVCALLSARSHSPRLFAQVRKTQSCYVEIPGVRLVVFLIQWLQFFAPALLLRVTPSGCACGCNNTGCMIGVPRSVMMTVVLQCGLGTMMSAWYNGVQ